MYDTIDVQQDRCRIRLLRPARGPRWKARTAYRPAARPVCRAADHPRRDERQSVRRSVLVPGGHVGRVLGREGALADEQGREGVDHDRGLVEGLHAD